MDEGTPSPYFTVNSEDHAGWLVVVSIVFLIYSVMGVVGKIILKVNITSMRNPDFILIASLALLLVQTAFIVSACNKGLGRHSASLDAEHFDTFAKYYYAASILAVVIQALTKISICLLISAISPDSRLLLANRVVMGIIIAWAVSGVFGISFACHLPYPWRETHDSICTSRRSIQLYDGIMNVLTDVVISILPIVMMWHVRTTMRRKVQVCALFGSRMLVPCLTIPALATSSAFYDHILNDPTYYVVAPVLFYQISLNLSVLTACIPGLKSVLENLVSGLAQARVQNDYDLTRSGDKKASFVLTPRHGSSSQSKNQSGSRSRAAQRFGLGGSRYSTSVTGGSQVPRRSKSDADKSLTDSTRNLTEGVIVRTDQYEVSSIQRLSAYSSDPLSRQSAEGHDEIRPAGSQL